MPVETFQKGEMMFEIKIGKPASSVIESGGEPFPIEALVRSVFGQISMEMDQLKDKTLAGNLSIRLNYIHGQLDVIIDEIRRAKDGD